MEVSPLSGITPIQPGGAAGQDGAAAGPPADRARREADATPAPSQMLALPAAHPVAVQAALQQAAGRAAEPRDGRAATESRGSALRGYGAAAHLLDTAQSFAERITLIPEPGDLSLEASRLPPNDTARDDGAGPRHIPADKRGGQA